MWRKNDKYQVCEDDDDEVYDDNAEVSIHILLLPLLPQLPPTHLPMVDIADTPQNNDTPLIL